jgi:hypothetical protein
MIANTGDAYTNPIISPLSLNRLYLQCENSHIVIDGNHNDTVKLFGIIKKEQYLRNEWSQSFDTRNVTLGKETCQDSVGV